jgi:hypothetical protein
MEFRSSQLGGFRSEVVVDLWSKWIPEEVEDLLLELIQEVMAVWSK